MISLISHTDFSLKTKEAYKNLISNVIKAEGFLISEVCVVFFNDSQLHKLNLQYLKHDSFTDVVTFDYSDKQQVAGDICVSVERVSQNAKSFGVSFSQELARVITHGVLHLCGYKDKTLIQKNEIRIKEDLYLERFFLNS
ncbi:MAG: rRNA maturation RNase YbeY [Flavobacteriaceae bacterium]|nr:rRNA maturation RNase YbeY [Flavobacteriaceae bacterium]|tara:strand:- start:917 stop:1336 length:420 start_codon:yes stop_codon:yes gene_type:complete